MNAAWIERVPFLRGLSPETRAALLAEAQVRTIEPGEALWRDGEANATVAFLLRGHVKLSMELANGKSTIVDLLGPGDLACSAAVFADEPYCCHAEPVSAGAQVLEIPKAVVMRVCQHDLSVVQELWRCQGCRGMSTCHRVAALAQGSVEQRVAALLMKLVERDAIGVGGRGADAKGDGKRVRTSVLLTRQEIADLCGTTVESAIRVMSRFKKRGLVDSAARGFVIEDPEALRTIAEGTLARRSSP